LKKGLPAVNYLGDVAKPLEFDNFSEPEEEKTEERPTDDAPKEPCDEEQPIEAVKPSKRVPPKADEYEWVWKVSLVVIQNTGV
jgi:hypothetical protein